VKKGGMKLNTVQFKLTILKSIFHIGTTNANDQNVAILHPTATNEEEVTSEVQDAREIVEAEKEIETIIDLPEEGQDHVHQEGQDHLEIEVTDTEKIIALKEIDLIAIDLIGMVEIITETIEIEITETVIIIDHLVTMRVAETTTEPERTTASTTRQKKRFIHISNARRKTKTPLEKTECSGMDSNGSKKHKGNMISNNLILLFRKTKKASKKPRRE